MKVQLNSKERLILKLIIIILLVVGLSLSNFFTWREATRNSKKILGVVNYINIQIQKGRLLPPETPKPQPAIPKKPIPKKPKKEANDA